MQPFRIVGIIYFAAIPTDPWGMPLISPSEVSPPLLFTLKQLMECASTFNVYKYSEFILNARSIGAMPVTPVTPLASINIKAPELLMLKPETLALCALVVYAYLPLSVTATQHAAV